MKKFLLLILIFTITLAHADNSKISPDLQALPPTQKAQVIVQYAPGTQVNCSGLLGLGFLLGVAAFRIFARGGNPDRESFEARENLPPGERAGLGAKPA